MAFKKKPDEPKKGAPEYMNTYGDMVTLMLTFFVLLYSMSNLDEQKFTALQESYAQAARSIIPGGLGDIFSNKGPSVVPQQSPLVEEPADDETGDQEVDRTTPAEGEQEMTTVEYQDAEMIDEMRAQRAELVAMESDFKTYLAQDVLASRIEVETPPDQYEYLLISFPDGMLYEPGRADLLPEARATLDFVLDKLYEYRGNKIRVEGHTDNVPQRREPYPSNRHLSSARADTVVEYMISEKNFDPMILEPVGMSEYYPIDTNDTEEGRARNRRVEIKVYAQGVGGVSGGRYPWE